MRVRADFSACYAQGRKYHSRYFLLFFLPATNATDHGGTRLGIAAGRKIGNAVHRNRIKRLVRESFRLERTLFPDNADIVVVAKRGINPMKLQLADVQKDLRIVMHRICREALPTPKQGSRHHEKARSDQPDF